MFSSIKNEPKKKKSFSLLNKKHVRSHSATSNSNSSATSESVIDNNNVNRGWLESSGVQVTPSRSSEISKTFKPTASTSTNLRKPVISDRSQQDILGTVSDEDIFKLTELTSRLPDLNTTTTTNTSTSKHHHHRHKRQTSSHVSSPPTETITSHHQSEDRIIPDPDENSRLYNNKSEAEAIVNEFYQKQGLLSRMHTINVDPITDKKRHSRSHTSQLTRINEQQQQQQFKRRHSIDTLLIANDDTIKRPEFNLHIPLDQQEDDDDDNASVKAIIEESEDTPSIQVEEAITLLFDYFSMPKEIKELLDIYEHKGKAERKKMTVKYKRKPQYHDDTSSSVHFSFYDNSSDDDEDDEEEEDDDTNTTVAFRDLIIGGHDKINYKSNPVRDIAILTTTISDNIEFTKLIQLNNLQQGPLLDLHVSMFTDDKNDFEIVNTEEEFSDILQDIDKKLSAVISFKKESKMFLETQLQALESLNLIHHDEQLSNQMEETSSFSSSSSSSMNIIEDSPPMKKTRDPFTDRQKEIERLIKRLNAELVNFKSSLHVTETLVSDVQLDMDDFRNRMETYIKDIPESHYSALKKLEVDIESILLKRAKNPWLDTGYALLSYLLTLFALIVWIIIYILKLLKKIVLFPRKLWKDYSDYLVERNKLVKSASVRSVSGHSVPTLSQQPQISIKPGSSLFRRNTSIQRKTTL